MQESNGGIVAMFTGFFGIIIWALVFCFLVVDANRLHQE